MRHSKSKLRTINTMPNTKFTLGQKVTWSSQSQGNHVRKVGTIVAVVFPKHQPDKKRFPSLHKAYCGGARPHESYVVEVPGKPKKSGAPGKPKVYWPVVSGLELEP